MDYAAESQECSDAAHEAALKHRSIEREAWLRAAQAFAEARDIMRRDEAARKLSVLASEVPDTDYTTRARAWERAARAHESAGDLRAEAWEQSAIAWRELAEKHRADEDAHEAELVKSLAPSTESSSKEPSA